ncbi:SH3 domain-containing protein [Roseinatronobacter sp.]|uniref:COG3650 family protein n=1 Tax=Roseinatronobacter sp. TaxID=1945755 RepID=UPI0025ECE09C|nr:SH3 domain-containing protein [Rhodobaca sp.]
MRRFLTSCVFVALAFTVQAQPFPQLFDVQDVAADDALNIRAEPNASAEIIGTLDHDAQGVEVVASNADNSWGRVNTGEGSGWVNLRYMSAGRVHIDNYNLPDGLFCYGTEPFWSASNIGGALHFDTPDMPGQDMPIWIAQDSGIAEDLRRMVHMGGIGGPASAFIYPASCNDGMSDREFGLAISLMTAPDAPLLSGCCTLNR